MTHHNRFIVIGPKLAPLEIKLKKKCLKKAFDLNSISIRIQNDKFFELNSLTEFKQKGVKLQET